MVVMININSGTKQWVFQRLCNALIVAVTVLLVVMLFMSPVDSYQAFSALFSATWFKLLISLCLVLFTLNSILAGWQIAGDYIKAPFVNKLFNTLCVVLSLLVSALGVYLLWL
jgi:succinate dehydrogenase / fumarate reductase membrane anchor subunit